MKSTSHNLDMTQTIRELLEEFGKLYQDYLAECDAYDGASLWSKKRCLEIEKEIIALFPTSKSYPNEYKPSTSKETVNINDWLEENKA